MRTAHFGSMAFPADRDRGPIHLLSCPLRKGGVWWCPHPYGLPQGALGIHLSAPSLRTPLTPTALLFKIKKATLGCSSEPYFCIDGRLLASFLPLLVRQTNTTRSPRVLDSATSPFSRLQSNKNIKELFTVLYRGLCCG